MSLPAAVPSTLVPRFPPELLTEILSQNDLSKADLANSCLVSKSFLDLTRPILYATIELRMITEPASPRWEVEDPWYDVRSIQYTDSSEKLVQILQDNPSLKSLIAVVGYTAEEEQHDPTKPIYASNDFVPHLLDIAPKARNFFFQYPPRSPSQAMSIEEEIIGLRAMSFTYDIAQHSLIGGGGTRPLKRLGCNELWANPKVEGTIKFDQLTVLEIKDQLQRPGLSLLGALLVAPNLRVLRISLFGFDKVSLRQFTHLEQLRLVLKAADWGVAPLDDSEDEEEDDDYSGEDDNDDSESDESEEEGSQDLDGGVAGSGDQEIEEEGGSDASTGFSQLSSITSLRLLAFDIDILPLRLLRNLQDLSGSPLHSRLLRIDFPLLTAKQQILRLLDPAHTFPAQRIGCSAKLRTNSTVAKEIRDACEIAGVELYWVEEWKGIGE